MRPMSIPILVNVVLGDSLPPRGPPFELDVIDVDPGIDHVDSNTLSAIGVVEVSVEGA